MRRRLPARTPRGPLGARSEEEAWGLVLNLAAELEEERPAVRERARILAELAERMLDQVERGIHRNPNPLLALAGNPPRSHEGIGTTTIRVYPPLGSVDRVDYRRIQSPRGYYFHEFSPSDVLAPAMVGPNRAVLILNREGRPLWGTEEEMR
jgi:hypothetical protein